MLARARTFLTSLLAIALSVFTLFEVNFGLMSPLSHFALFAIFGLVLCFLLYPMGKRWGEHWVSRSIDLILAGMVVVTCGYLIWQGQALTNDRVGQFTTTDFWVAMIGVVLVLEATRRSIGLALPLVSGTFLLYAYFGASMPDWFFPHRGYDLNRIAAKCFLGSEGVFGVAMGVMFTYVFLFVVFGAFLEMSGATEFIIQFARRVFGRSTGGPAKVAVLGSGLMGSLSGSAVANAVTTGTFSIPMMRSAGFKPHIAGGIMAAASSGGALVPPVMGAGAYMMLEIIDPPVDFLQIAKAALIPAGLYYLSILLIVHFYSRRVGDVRLEEEAAQKPMRFEGLVFFGALGALIGFLLVGYTPFRAVTYSLEVILLLSIASPRIAVTRRSRQLTAALFVAVTLGVALFQSRGDFAQLIHWTTWADAAIPAMLLVLLAGLAHPVWRPLILQAFLKSARAGVSLVSASACVGIVIGVVGLTGVGTAFPAAIVPLAESSLLLALLAIMACSIILGMGLPSAVCYLLMATLIGPVLNKMGVIPLAAHLFIFYFGMMSMVTPPVALAAYASASIAKASIMPTAMAGFRFSLVGFTLPYMFIYRPALLLMDPQGNALGWGDLLAVFWAVGAAVLGIVALAAGIAGYFRAPIAIPMRVMFLLAAAALMIPKLTIGGRNLGGFMDLGGAIFLVVLATINWRKGSGEGGAEPERLATTDA